MRESPTDAAPSRMPVLFIGHGSPMNAIEDNAWSRAHAALAETFPTPKAILCVSAHWYVGGTFVTGNAAPKTIHDFGGFPRALFEVQYPAPGDTHLAAAIARSVPGVEVRDDWGLDHGTWSVLRHLRPTADVPVLQLSLDRRKSPEEHLAIGRALAPLRDQGVLILGSGNITHNLRHAFTSGGSGTPAWAAEFDAGVAEAVSRRNAAYLIGALDTDAGRACHPTPDHYWPLLYAFGAAAEDDPVAFPITGFEFGSLSMRSIRFG